MIKYSGEKLIKEVSRILNLIVKNKIQEDSFIGSGILVTVQKQGKPKGQLTSLTHHSTEQYPKNIIEHYYESYTQQNGKIHRFLSKWIQKWKQHDRQSGLINGI